MSTDKEGVGKLNGGGMLTFIDLEGDQPAKESVHELLMM